MRHVVITGGTGFIGQAVSACLARVSPDTKVTVLGSETDLTDRQAVDALFQAIADAGGCDHLIHLAACAKPGGWMAQHPARAYHTNMMINLNVFEARSVWLAAAKMTSVSSYAIYPSGPHPHTEAEAFGGEPEDGLFAYGHSKRALLVAQEAYRREQGLVSVCVALPTVYGPRPDFSETAHLVGALTGKFLRAVRDRSDVVSLWGDGRQVRDFLHVTDAAQGIVQAAAAQTSALINLGSGRAEQIRDLAELIAAETGYSGRIDFQTDQYAGESVRRLDVSRAKSELGWVAQISLQQGVREFVAWSRACLGQRPEMLD